MKKEEPSQPSPNRATLRAQGYRARRYAMPKRRFRTGTGSFFKYEEQHWRADGATRGKKQVHRYPRQLEAK